MQLSRILQYLEYLKKMQPTGGNLLMNQEYDPVVHYMENSDIAQAQHLEKLKVARNQILAGIENFDSVLAEIDTWAKKESEPLQKKLFSESYSIYEEMTQSPESYFYHTDAILDNRAPMSDENIEFVKSRLMVRNTWKDSALIIRPGLEDWISYMVAFDPLYVFDHFHALLEPAQLRFNDIYTNRVRWCVGLDHDTKTILSAIPNNQIGFCFAWYFFYWKPFEVIRSYLEELYTKLRPGGVLAFTFNDGDRSGGAINAEKYCGCFVPGSMLRSFGESLGYETVLYRELDRATTWIEFQKPGKRVSLKGGQSLAQIIPKPKKKIDIPSKRVYTDEEIEFLQQQAIDLNIDTPQMIRSGYTPETLEKIISQRKKL